MYFNPEAAQGVPLSRLTGLAGFTNGEISRTAGPHLRLYRARLYAQQVISLSGATTSIEEGENQLAMETTARRAVFTVGNLALLDIFDENRFAHDPRSDFLNWAFMTHAAYDYAADARGYSWGGVAEFYWDDWAVRVGRFAQPKEPNQLPLDSRIFVHFGDQLEIERQFNWSSRAGALRVLGMRNRARMARYADALRLANATGSLPDLNLVRSAAREKFGVGLNIEQELSATVGVFGRGFWADGETETYAFTEADRSASGGVTISGEFWGRALDRAGIALARQWLSAPHREYLRAGGLGFFLGDGALRYRPETVLELFYAVPIVPQAEVTLDYQAIWNPGYNADRGPVQVWSTRFRVLL